MIRQELYEIYNKMQLELAEAGDIETLKKTSLHY